MGAGGRMSAEERFEHPKAHEAHDPFRRAPTAKPPFTLGEIKKAVPPHCFNRSALHSFSYVVHDLAVSSFLFYVAIAFFPHLPSPVHLLAWPLYWAVQGCVLTGAWVIAHECGHHAFSDYSLLDDVVGLVLHSALLVPYFSWKYSHRRHHANTGSLERDEVFVPKPKAKLAWFSRYLNNPPGRVLSLFVTLTLGWPLYLAFNVSGRRYDTFACHFDPYGPIYSDRERLQIYISDAGVLAMAYALFQLVCSENAHLYPLFAENDGLSEIRLPFANGSAQVFPGLGGSRLRRAAAHRERLPGAHHVPAAHPPGAAPLRLVGVGLAAGRAGDGGPGLRRAQPRVPPHHRHPRRAPPLLDDATLPRHGGDQGGEAPAGAVLPVRRDALVPGHVEGGEGVHLRGARRRRGQERQRRRLLVPQQVLATSAHPHAFFFFRSSSSSVRVFLFVFF